jgi:hypothetical protein
MAYTINIFAANLDDFKIYNLNGDAFKYSTPSPFQFATTMPNNGWQFLKSSFSFTDDNLKAWAAIIALTGVLIIYDQKITNNVQQFGRWTGIGNKEGTVGTLKIGSTKLLRRPNDLGSTFYFIGDGWVTLGLSGGFLTAGLISKDQRELTVASELLQGILLTGITTQLIKRLTGRESPIKSESPGGKWRFFPSTKTYQGNISKYDAFPSGHLATTMTTFMIISENYSEYTWIKPVGYTMMGLLGFQMVNNSVHWISDYPLAIGIGYMLGRTIVDNGRKKEDKNKNEIVSDVQVTPILSPRGETGINVSMSF